MDMKRNTMESANHLPKTTAPLPRNPLPNGLEKEQQIVVLWLIAGSPGELAFPRDGSDAAADDPQSLQTPESQNRSSLRETARPNHIFRNFIDANAIIDLTEEEVIVKFQKRAKSSSA